MQQNPDRRPLPLGCVTHLDDERKQWYYVHLQTNPPRVTFIHPADETPQSSSPQNSHSPARGSTPQHQQQQQQQQFTASYRQSMYNQNSSSQQFSPTFANPMPTVMQNPAVQQQPMYGSQQSFGQSTSFVQDYTSRQQQNYSPPENNSSSFAMHRARQPSEAQSIYGTSIPQSLHIPSDNRFTIYSTNGHATSQEMEFDASILYTSPTSASPNSTMPSRAPVAVSQIFQPNRREVMMLDSSETFSTTPFNHATHPSRSQSIQVSDPATRRYQPPNVLRRRKTKATSIFAPIPQKPVEPPAFQKPTDVPVYNLVAQAPLDAVTTMPTTPSFQSLLYSVPPIQNSGPLRPGTQTRTQSLPPISISNQSTMMEGLPMPQNSAPATTSGSMTIPQQPLSPLRAQTTGASASMLPYLNGQTPSLMHASSTMGLSNGTMGAPLNLTMNHTPSLMSMSPHPLDGYSNGTNALPMTSIPPLMMNQPQSLMSTHTQLNGLPNGTMSLSGAPMLSTTSIPPQFQQPNDFSNGLSGNYAMAQSSLNMPPLQPNMMLNGYAQGLPSGAIQMQGGMPGQAPMIMEDPAAAAKAEKNKKNKQAAKKIGLSLGKAVLKFGAKHALGSIGIDEDLAAAAVNVAASGVAAAANAVSNSNNQQ